MFLRLIPAFVEKYKPKKIFIAPGNRLVPLFHGTLPRCEILNGDNARALDSSLLNYQFALGDLPRYISNLFPSNIITGDPPVFKPANFSDSVFPPVYINSSTRRPRVGISWLGGGRADRLKLKSLDSKLFFLFSN